MFFDGWGGNEETLKRNFYRCFLLKWGHLIGPKVISPTVIGPMVISPTVIGPLVISPTVIGPSLLGQVVSEEMIFSHQLIRNKYRPLRPSLLTNRDGMRELYITKLT